MLQQRCQRDLSPGLIACVNGTSVWRIVCFVIRAGLRRRGLTHLLEAAVQYAREMGAESFVRPSWDHRH